MSAASHNPRQALALHIRRDLHERAMLVMRLWSLSGAGTHFPGENTSSEVVRVVRVDLESAKKLRSLILGIQTWIDAAQFEEMPLPILARRAERIGALVLARKDAPFQESLRRITSDCALSRARGRRRRGGPPKAES